jgi:ABC-2 type transport system permease protein
MKSIVATFLVEILKIRKSRIFLISLLISFLIPLMMGFLMFVVKNPEFSSKLGIVSTKAFMFGKADWPTYFGLLTEGIAGIGAIGFAFVTSWVFGREYSDRTVTDLLALPVSRSFIVLSKFMVVGIWCALFSLIFFVFGILFGGIIGLSGWSGEIASLAAYNFTITSLLTILLCTPIAFFASYGRGYLPPMGFAISTLIAAQFIGILGLAPYFPWAIPVTYSTMSADSAQLGAISYSILLFTSIIGFLAAFAWWRYADQT